jgi:N-acetylmuramic acid 6-phosphate etherase
MALTRTEQVHTSSKGLDMLPFDAIARLLADAQAQAAAVVAEASAAIAKAAEMAADCLGNGGRIAYAAAGSSGLMALADALEMPGTFGIPRDRIVVLMAGGAASLAELTGGPEDDADQAASDVDEAGLRSGDCLVAVSASGATPYAVAALHEARRSGLRTVAIANNGGTPLVEAADIAVVLATPPEVIAGSTRMGAGTAQKIALNIFSTLIAVRLGHVHDGLMVNLHADNLKLQERAVRIVATIGGVSRDRASDLLDAADGSVKSAILLAAGAADARAASHLLESTGQRLRPALVMLEEGSARSRHNGT